MAIKLANEPKGGADIVRKGLGRFTIPANPITLSDSALAALTDGSSALKAAQGPDIDLFHPVYDLDAGDVVAGGTLEAAKLTGFRYLVRRGEGELSAAEVRAGASHGGTPATMTMRIYGPYAKAVKDGLAQLERLPSVSTGAYELRVLHCRAIFVAALWLKGDHGARDILWPLPSAPHEFRPDHPYSAEEFLNIVRPLIQARVAAHAAFVEGKPYGD